MFGKRKYETIVIAVCIGSLSAVAAGQDWQPEAHLRVATDGDRACIDSRGNIYALGGVEHVSPARPNVEMLAFDHTTSTYAGAWIEIAPMIVPRAAPSVVCIDDFVYAIGGYASSAKIASVERLDTRHPAAGWEQLPSSKWLTTPRNSAATVVDHAGRVYVIGGSGATGFLDTVEVYDPAHPANGWTVLHERLGTARIEHGGVTAPDGKIWAIGGQGVGGTHLDSVEIYDPANPTAGWQPGPSITGPNSNADPATLGADGNIYVAGAWLPGINGRAMRYNFRAREWQEVDSLAQPRNRPAMVLGKNGRVFAIAGGSATGPFANVESLDTTFCFADCDQSTGKGTLDIFDWLCFQMSFHHGESYACDCDTSTGFGVCDIFDFLCFQKAFVGGCA